MPMAPSLIALTTYGSLKVAGYAGASLVVSKFIKVDYPPLRFGLLKTGLGFLGGLLTIGVLIAIDLGALPDGKALLLAAPMRLVIWYSLLFYCFKLDRKSGLIYILSILGTAYSYLLDYIMVLLFDVLPGMSMPWC